MARRNKTLSKLRAYRDKLITKNLAMQSRVREQQQMMNDAYAALVDNNVLNAIACLLGEVPYQLRDERKKKDHFEAASMELALVYRILAAERDFTQQISRAVEANDYLRAKALVSQHVDYQIDSDKTLRHFSEKYGMRKIDAKVPSDINDPFDFPPGGDDE